MTPHLDLRLVIGLFFALVGALLLCAGLFASDTLGSGVPSSVIDLACGGALLVFGAGMALASYLSRRKP